MAKKNRSFNRESIKMPDEHVYFVLEPYWSYGDRMKPNWSYGDRLKTVELTRGVDFMCGCIYGLVHSYTFSHGLVRSLIYDFTRTGHPCQFFKSFENQTRLSRIHSNGPSVTRIRSRLYVRFTRMANRISRVFCVRQAKGNFMSVKL